MDEPGRTASADGIWAEVARISASTDFARAPVMRRLLDFLVRATLDGRGEQLKAYAVAVDGLGRPEDFDAQADSYPRVQVGRLRRMLETFYARDGAGNGYRLSIPSGRYRVLFEAPGAEDAAESAARAPVAHGDRRPLAALGAVVALLLVAAVGWLVLGPADSADAELPQAPVLQLVHLRAPATADAIEVDADALLLDGLRRSWIVRVQADQGQRDSDDAKPAYVLTGSVSDGATPVLRLNLMRGGSGEMVWTGQATLPADRAGLREAIAPLVADLIQPYGVIATDQRARMGASLGPGYPCILRFDQYRRDHSAAMHAQVQACLARTQAAGERDAPTLAARSFLALDDRLYGFAPGRADAPAASLGYARRAVAADPYSAFAHLALARASVFTGDCAAAARAGRRAVALNPHDPDQTALVALGLLHCGDPEAEALLRRAIALDPNAPAHFFAPLVFLAIERGDLPAARAAADAMAPPHSVTTPLYDVVLAAVAVAEGDEARARAVWARLAATDPRTARDPRIVFERWMIPARLQTDILRRLQGAGLIGAEAASPRA